MKPNGHDPNAVRANGHAGVSSPPAAPTAPRKKGQAASDDARDLPTAAATHPVAAGTERAACAEVARRQGGPPPDSSKTNREPNHGKTPPPAGKKTASKKAAGKNEHTDEGQVNIPPGSEPLPADGPGFVDAMHEHVDLYLACARLVKSKDEKIAERIVERLLEMSYGKSPAPPNDDAQQIIFDAPRPARE